jgi:hypothetical protein
MSKEVSKVESSSKKKVGLLKEDKDPIELSRRYIHLLLAYSGVRVTNTELDVLACYSYFGDLDAAIKKKLAAKHKTSVASISNVITRLRKRSLVIGKGINAKLKAPSLKDGESCYLVVELKYKKK